MAMFSGNKEEKVNNEMVAKNQEAIDNAATNNEEVTEVKEKKKFSLKGTGKKVLKWTGIAAGAVGLFAAGVFAGKATSKKSSDPELVPEDPDVEDDVEIVEF